MKVSIIGIGKVGVTLAYSIVTHSLASELVLVGRDAQRTRGEALDLQHAAALSPGRMEIRQGDVSATAQSHVVVLTLSAPPTAGLTLDRLAQAEPNAELFRSIVPDVAKLSPDAILLVVSNPVDVLTYATIQLSGLDPSRVFGTGTLIDSARFRSYLSSHFGIHTDDIRAYVLGEHGESQFPALSGASAGGWNLGDDPAVQDAFEKTVRVGSEVMKAKGHTCFAVASAAAMIIEAIGLDSNRTMPVSTLVEGYYGIEDVCLSLPAVIGRQGITQCLEIALNAEEQKRLGQSARQVSEVIGPLRRFWADEAED